MRTMLASPPYNSWPLHVKIFNIDAVREWSSAANSIPDSALPLGLTVSVELEGVDGKGTRPIVGAKGLPRKTRNGPIDVKDGGFSVSLLSSSRLSADPSSSTYLPIPNIGFNSGFHCDSTAETSRTLQNS
jgi:structure-specific endonuclease subunit SLX1